MLTNIRELQKRIHVLNHRWWHDEQGNRLERNKGELLCLIHSEISEAVEGVLTGAMDDHLPDRKMEEVEMADAAIRICDYAEGFGYDLQSVEFDVDQPWVGTKTIRELARVHMHISRAMEGERKSKHLENGRPVAEYELAFALHLIADYCDECRFDLIGAIEAKLAYNQKRQDHTYEARARANGKKW